ncbi:MAG TPA: glyoxalase [Acidobacteria bacterium]|nr:glyoxalase [Acidobacteriota bacterium]
MRVAHFILFVTDQEASTHFYAAALDRSPRLHVPGMSEFDMPGGAVLGLMPAAGIRRLLGEVLPDPAAASGIPRSELYLLVDDAAACLARAEAAGARVISPVMSRDWGHEAGYALDLDGHLLAFAQLGGGS